MAGAPPSDRISLFMKYTKWPAIPKGDSSFLPTPESGAQGRRCWGRFNGQAFGPGLREKTSPGEEGIVIFSLDPPIGFFVYSGHSTVKLQNLALFIDGSGFVSRPILISTAFRVCSMAKRFQ